MSSNVVFAGKNYNEPPIDEAHIVTAHGGVEETMQYLTDSYQSQSSSALVESFVASCDTHQRVKQSNKPSLGHVTPLPIPVRRSTDNLIDFLKLTPVFITCSTMYPNLEIDTDHILYISRIWFIVDRHSGYKFLIPIPNNFKAEL